jgi:hypothetical protein
MAQFVKGTTFEGKLDIVKKKCPCDIEGCDASFDFPSKLKRHKEGVHDIGVVWYHCEHCDSKFKSNDELKRHLRYKHEIGIQWFNCEHCDSKFKSNGELKQHLLFTHDIGVIWHICEHCDSKFKNNGKLSRHLASVHDIGVIWHDCEQCDSKFKSNDDLKRHKSFKHDIDVQWFNCEHCDSQFKTNGDLKQHLLFTHDIGVSYFKCDQCDSQFKSKGNLKQHLAYIHDICVIWHKCEYCHSKFKYNGNLKKHIQFVHDIGDHECDFCAHNRNSKIEYKDHCGTHEICRECFKKVTGKSSRIEIKWSDYLDENLGIVGLVSSDKSLKSIGGCSLYRPDKLYLFQDTVELAECDENQHSGSNYECDERRLSEIYEETGIMGKFMYVIRWNPDAYFPKDNIKKKQKERFEIYIALVKKLRLLQHLDKIHIYYLFYSVDNDNISQNLPFTHIHSMDDVENL